MATRAVLLAGLALLLSLCAGSGCFGTSVGGPRDDGAAENGSSSQPSNGTGRSNPSDALRDFPLSELPTAVITLKDREIRVWLAATPDTQQEGLMHVTAGEIADDQGMLFVFPAEAQRFFWMKNTVISLDIAYARSDGTIVRTWTMPPLTLQNYPSVEPAMFALEMKAGSFERLGVKAGDRIAIPPDVFNASP